MTENEHTMTTAEAAALLRLSPRRLRDKVKTKGLPCVRWGRDLRFSRREVLEWQDKQRPRATRSTEAPAATDLPPEPTKPEGEQG